MNARQPGPETPSNDQEDRYLASTHEVFNQPPALENYNLFEQDIALQEAALREGAGKAAEDLKAFGALAGAAQTIDLGFRANANKPVFNTHDRFGHRIDEVDFHPAYHELMRIAFDNGLHSSPWSHPGQGAHVARAAKYYMHSQVEAAHCCPVTMTFAAIPSIRKQPELAADWEARILADSYDPRNLPDSQKSSVTIGMAMTEK
ncbi:MAG TPA: DNA alkylation response protein, partial [Marinobacter adhaerens]|nr:DNA alkylation response protein [Marinobacter adhaerens]